MVCRVLAHINKQIDPALLPVALKKMARRGPAAFSITFSMSPATRRRQTRKMKPVKTPIPTQASMILGPSTDGLGISSIWNGPAISKCPIEMKFSIYEPYAPQHQIQSSPIPLAAAPITRQYHLASRSR